MPKIKKKQVSLPVNIEMEVLRPRINAALKVLKTQPHVDKKNIVARGCCFGGTQFLSLQDQEQI